MICKHCTACASVVGQRTGIINQIRAFLLERGIAVRQGVQFLRAELPTILATRSDALSPSQLRLIEDLAGDWRRLDERLEGISDEIEALARRCDIGLGAGKVMTCDVRLGSGSKQLSLSISRPVYLQ